MTSNFVIWKYKSIPDGCVLKDLRGLEKTYRLNNGTPLAAEFPASVELHVDPDFPNDLVVGDNVLNTDMVIVASKRFCDAVRALVPTGVELLPVKLIDPEGGVASERPLHCSPGSPGRCHR